jgi:peptide deformylase
MARLPILEYPDPRLRTKAVPVATCDGVIRTLVADLFETMYAAPGIGLAASQVDVHRRVLVTDVSEEQDQGICLINPEIIYAEGKTTYEEGCLSVPGFYDEVERAEQIKVRALNPDGEGFEMEAEGLLSICIQHEMDHMDGKLFVDYLSELKRGRLRKRFLKQRRQPSAARAGAPSL